MLKNKSNINYSKFLKYSKLIEGKSEKEIEKITINYYKNVNLNKFAKALKTDGKRKRKYKLNIKKAGQFIDIDTYKTNGDLELFIKALLKVLPFYYFKSYSRLSIWDVECLTASYNEFKQKLVDKYDFIFNPPSSARAGEITQGTLERKAFSEHYGGYIEIIYVLLKGDFTKFEKVINYDLDRFMFQGEYLLRKRYVENIK